MSKPTEPDNPESEPPLSREVKLQALRKRKALHHSKRSVWLGLGMSGLIGWSVAVPTVIGAAVGVWIDNKYPSRYSWTLMLLLLGLLFGCSSAWRWVASELREIKEESDG